MKDSELHHLFVWINVVVMISSLILMGCSGDTGLKCVIVNGQVVFDGEPIENGEIRFRPLEGAGFNSGGPIRNGKYTVRNKGGVPVGNHKVVIYAYATNESEKLPEGIPDIAGEAEVQYIPPKYNDKSELTATVSGDEDPQTIDFSLEK